MAKDAVTRVSAEIAGSEISFETGRMAKQASGAVVVQQGDTMVLATAVAGSVRDVDFLPLTVDVEERMYATGKIPGSFFKREGRPGEKATLTARMIDRPIRPLFPKDWRYDTQLVAIPLSIDHVHPYDILAMNGASAALMLSDIPLPTPVGAVRIGKVDGNFVVNPSEEDLLAEGEGEDEGNRSDLDLVVAGTEDAILMVEAGANEIPEAEILDALDIAHAAIKKLCELQRELAEKAGKEKKAYEAIKVDEDLLAQIRSSHGSQLDAATQVEDKLERQDATKAVEEAIVEQYGPPAREGATDEEQQAARERRAAAKMAFESLEKSIIRERIAVHKKRPDGRSEDEIRDITIEVGVTPRTHGSALFTRGQTQALSVVAHRHAEGGDAPRHARPGDEKVLLAPLQLPALLGRGGRAHGRRQTPRHRPRRARRAGADADGPLDRGVPLLDPGGVRHPRVQRLLLDGLGVRLLAVADGRGRADQAPRGGDRDGPDQRGRRLHRPDRHRRRRGPPRRHGLQGRRHHRRASPRCRWTSRSRASRSRSCATPSPRPTRRGRSSSGRWPRSSRARASSSAATRRASRRSRSTPPRSAC